MQFHAGEPIEGYRRIGWNNRRCGSVFTAKIDGVSLYGHIRRFVRASCPRSGTVTDLAVVTWFAKPEYPTGDVLTVRIDTRKPPATASNILNVSEIDPSRILYEMDDPFIYMMRVEGLDIGF